MVIKFKQFINESKQIWYDDGDVYTDFETGKFINSVIPWQHKEQNKHYDLVSNIDSVDISNTAPNKLKRNEFKINIPRFLERLIQRSVYFVSQTDKKWITAYDAMVKDNHRNLKRLNSVLNDLINNNIIQKNKIKDTSYVDNERTYFSQR